jgi:hypothetical protein
MFPGRWKISRRYESGAKEKVYACPEVIGDEDPREGVYT